MPIRAVWFDVGETLIDETREYGTWADWLGVPRHTFSAMFGAVIARGGDYREVFQHFKPGFDLAAKRQARLDAGMGEYFNGLDLYRDARPCLQALKDAGYLVGIAGNQTARAAQFIRELNLPADLIATSDDWGVEKPDPRFFSKLLEVSGHTAKEVVYVGDRFDNDLFPAKSIGLLAVWLKRGPWSFIQADNFTPAVDTLHQLLQVVPFSPRRVPVGRRGIKAKRTASVATRALTPRHPTRGAAAATRTPRSGTG